MISPNLPSFNLHCSSFTALTPSNQNLVTSICQIHEPSSYSQVVMHLGWKIAMDNVFAALDSNNTRDIVELPQGKKRHCLANGCTK